MNNGINPAHGALAAPVAPLEMGSPVRNAPEVPHAPPSIKLEYLKAKQARRNERDAQQAAEPAAGAPESAKRRLNFQGG